LLDEKPAVILETGSSAWGANSSLLFDNYVNSFGGTFKTVDIRLEPGLSLRTRCTVSSRMYCDDSIHFLEKMARTKNRIDLVYLDSWDVNWANPIPSAMHGLREFLAISKCLGKGSLLLVDDTPADLSVMQKVQPDHVVEFRSFADDYGFFPGKGALIKQLLLATGKGKQIAHEYQLLWQF
jgi:hypothetical protein